MAYVNTGNKRSFKFTLTKLVGGVVQPGYPKTYDGQVSWGNSSYPTLTDKQARQLTDSEYTARLNAFHSYVESIESGFDASADFTNSEEVTDETACPPPPTTTTTTTTAAATTTTTAAATTTTAAATTTTTAAATTTTSAAA